MLLVYATMVVCKIKQKVVEIFRTIREKKCWDLNGDPYNLLLSIVRRVKDTELTASVQRSMTHTTQSTLFPQMWLITYLNVGPNNQNLNLTS